MNIGSWLERFFDTLTHYSDSGMRIYAREFSNMARGEFGTSNGISGAGDIIGCMGPFELFAAVFLLFALIFTLTSGKANGKGKARFASFCAVVAFALNAAWYFLWLLPAKSYFNMVFRAAQTACIVVAVFLLILFLVARGHARKAAVKPAELPKPAENTAESASGEKTKDYDALTSTLRREMSVIERQIEEVKKRRAALDNEDN